jgi:5'-methylthioadenosine phosphorylase
VDRTSGRKDTFYDGPITTHISAADPYCPILRAQAIQVCKDLGISVHEMGPMVVIQGPRFSTKAESQWFTRMGWEVVGMTQYPECYLARELEMAYVTLAVVTDYDAGLFGQGGVHPVTTEEVMTVFRANLDKLRSVVVRLVETLPDTSASPARNCLSAARFD